MSKTIEKLTDDERGWLHRHRCAAPRIIDAQAAENAQLRAGHEQALNERDAAHNAMAEWGRMLNEAYTLYRAEGAKRDAADARLATLTAENARLRAIVEENAQNSYAAIHAAEARLAAAEGRLAAVQLALDETPYPCEAQRLASAVEAALASAQPAQSQEDES